MSPQPSGRCSGSSGGVWKYIVRQGSSGALATVQQVGNALGVALTGVLFFSLADNGIVHAFQVSEIELAVLLLGVAALSRLLPGKTS